MDYESLTDHWYDDADEQDPKGLEDPDYVFVKVREKLEHLPIQGDAQYNRMVSALQFMVKTQRTGLNIDHEYENRATEVMFQTEPVLWDSTDPQLAAILRMLFTFLKYRNRQRPIESILVETFLWGFEAGWDWSNVCGDLGGNTASKRLQEREA